jgi:5-hydroxyisourate hydrolase
MSGISTHVLDLTLGKPASNLPVKLERFESDGWIELVSTTTNANGRCEALLPPEDVTPGEYRLTFKTGTYHATSLYTEVAVCFAVTQGSVNYHLPLLLSPHGYTTYRGS